ncbi:hypothetical protein NDU88_001713 [Pleurodeles waltl]|uniref:Uncharacterized protein n=1 Tax=Pleurodeles waltl TaxID=8319 RepID=A0AAV7M033_PLEWA|nr:hypothetical protein NDU88_001713 [Pleurodeles waltl]
MPPLHSAFWEHVSSSLKLHPRSFYRHCPHVASHCRSTKSIGYQSAHQQRASYLEKRRHPSLLRGTSLPPGSTPVDSLRSAPQLHRSTAVLCHCTLLPEAPREAQPPPPHLSTHTGSALPFGASAVPLRIVPGGVT